MSAELSILTALIMPLVGAFGIAVVEAFSQGLPVIASPYGSLQELVTPEMGVICQDYQAFEKVLAPFEHKFNGEKIRRIAYEKFSSKAIFCAML